MLIMVERFGKGQRASSDKAGSKLRLQTLSPKSLWVSAIRSSALGSVTIATFIVFEKTICSSFEEFMDLMNVV